jgi:hypothetical protein
MTNPPPQHLSAAELARAVKDGLCTEQEAGRILLFRAKRKLKKLEERPAEPEAA